MSRPTASIRPPPIPPPQGCCSSQTPAVQAPPAKDDFQATAPALGAAGVTTFVQNVNFVEVPVIVKDSKGKQVAGLTYRDFKVFENNTREVLRAFSVEPTALSIAFVIDQSLTSDVMNKVNEWCQTAVHRKDHRLVTGNEPAAILAVLTGGGVNHIPGVRSGRVRANSISSIATRAYDAADAERAGYRGCRQRAVTR